MCMKNKYSNHEIGENNKRKYPFPPKKRKIFHVPLFQDQTSVHGQGMFGLYIFALKINLVKIDIA